MKFSSNLPNCFQLTFFTSCNDLWIQRSCYDLPLCVNRNTGLWHHVEPLHENVVTYIKPLRDNYVLSLFSTMSLLNKGEEINCSSSLLRSYSFYVHISISWPLKAIHWITERSLHECASLHVLDLGRYTRSSNC